MTFGNYGLRRILGNPQGKRTAELARALSGRPGGDLSGREHPPHDGRVQLVFALGDLASVICHAKDKDGQGSFPLSKASLVTVTGNTPERPCSR